MHRWELDLATTHRAIRKPDKRKVEYIFATRSNNSVCVMVHGIKHNLIRPRKQISYSKSLAVEVAKVNWRSIYIIRWFKIINIHASMTDLILEVYTLAIYPTGGHELCTQVRRVKYCLVPIRKRINSSTRAIQLCSTANKYSAAP